MEHPDRRLDRGRATRQKLTSVATELFAGQGYEHTSIEAVLERAEMSRGSLYHHFPSKQALFEGVVDAVEAQVGEAIVAAASGTDTRDPVGVLRAAFLAWVRLAGDQVVRQILLIDAPAVVGWRKWREIEEQYGLGMIKAVLNIAAEQGRVPSELVDSFSHVLLASVNELGLMIALADDVPAAQASARTAVEELLERLLRPAAHPRSTRHRS